MSAYKPIFIYAFNLNIILWFFLISGKAIGQNLIPNPYFEDTTTCPSNVSGQYGDQIYSLNSWFPALNSADYFNSCSTDSFQQWILVSVPNNLFGTQNAFNGNGYVGLYLYHFGANYREYIGVPLMQSLSIGTKYYFKATVSSAFGSYTDIRTFCNNFGILLSETKYEAQTNPLNIPNHSTAHYDSIISDTTNWQQIELSFVADSAYTYLYMGNFYDDLNSDTIQFSPQGGQGAYIYIDNVCISTDSMFCSALTSIVDYESYHYKIYPNPTNSILNIESNNHGNILLFNYQGILVSEFFKDLPVLQIDVRLLPKGIYFIRDRSLFTHKVLIN